MGAGDDDGKLTTASTVLHFMHRGRLGAPPSAAPAAAPPCTVPPRAHEPFRPLPASCLFEHCPVESHAPLPQPSLRSAAPSPTATVDCPAAACASSSSSSSSVMPQLMFFNYGPNVVIAAWSLDLKLHVALSSRFGRFLTQGNIYKTVTTREDYNDSARSESACQHGSNLPWPFGGPTGTPRITASPLGRYSKSDGRHGRLVTF